MEMIDEISLMKSKYCDLVDHYNYGNKFYYTICIYSIISLNKIKESLFFKLIIPNEIIYIIIEFLINVIPKIKRKNQILQFANPFIKYNHIYYTKTYKGKCHDDSFHLMKCKRNDYEEKYIFTCDCDISDYEETVDEWNDEDPIDGIIQCGVVYDVESFYLNSRNINNDGCL